jgi:hypothetical protein
MAENNLEIRRNKYFSIGSQIARLDDAQLRSEIHNSKTRSSFAIEWDRSIIELSIKSWIGSGKSDPSQEWEPLYPLQARTHDKQTAHLALRACVGIVLGWLLRLARY